MKPSSPPSYSKSTVLSKQTETLITANIPTRGIMFTSSHNIEAVSIQPPIIVTCMDGITSSIATSPTLTANDTWKKLTFIPLSIQNLQQAGDRNSTFTWFTVFS
jgi:hypothetical protein